MVYRLLRLRYQERSPEVWSCSAALGRRGTTAGAVAEVVAVRVDWSLTSYLPSYCLNCRYPRFRSRFQSSHLLSYYLGWMGCS